MLRTSKILLVAAVAFYCFLVVFNNVTDSYTNLHAMVQAMAMKELFPESHISYRAITNPILPYIAFAAVVFFELLSGVLCALGAWHLFKARHESAAVFNQAKKLAVIGLTCGFLTWQVFFMSIAGEWFGMWMSAHLAVAITTSFHIFMMMLGVLIYLVMKDE